MRNGRTLGSVQGRFCFPITQHHVTGEDLGVDKTCGLEHICAHLQSTKGSAISYELQ